MKVDIMTYQNTYISKIDYEPTNLDIDYFINYNLYLKGYSKCTLRANTALNIFRAVDFAKYINLPLNNFVTITFDNNSKEYSNEVFSKIRNAINRWIKNLGHKDPKYNIPPTWVFVFENKVGRMHVHWLIHIHKDLRSKFLKKIPLLLEKYQGVPLNDGQIDIQKVNPYEDKTIANYLCKGINTKFIDFFHLQNRASFQGYIDWQRARVSTNLGPKRIKKSGFNASLQRHEWIELHPHIAEGWSQSEKWDINEVVPQLTGAKKFIGFKEHWKILLRETAYYARRVSTKPDKVNGSIPRIYAEQAAKLAKIKKQLNYSI